MAEDDNKDSRTEEPTEKRLQKAREDGDVPMSMEVRNMATIVSALVIVALMAPWLVGGFGDLLGGFLGQVHALPLDSGGLRRAVTDLLVEVGLLMALPVGLLVVVAFAGTIGQVGFLYTPKKLKPRLDQLDPVKGVKRLFAKQKVVDFLKSVFKLVVVAAAIFLIVAPNFPHPDVFLGKEFGATLHELHWLLILLLISVIIGFAPIMVADFVWTRHSYRTKLKMTKQEVKDEHKQTEGDPQIKGRIRSLRLKRSRERMMSMVPEASVVVTNPTHFAVALQYDMEAMAAPKVVAKGADFLARKIREIAEEHDVPIVENPPLARGLYASVELDQEIPPEHYKAVAEVIGYVMRLKSGAHHAAAGGAR